MQRIQADEVGAAGRGRANDAGELAEIADPPPVVRDERVELHGQSPAPPALLQRLRLMAPRRHDDDARARVQGRVRAGDHQVVIAGGQIRHDVEVIADAVQSVDVAAPHDALVPEPHLSAPDLAGLERQRPLDGRAPQMRLDVEIERRGLGLALDEDGRQGVAPARLALGLQGGAHLVLVVEGHAHRREQPALGLRRDEPVLALVVVIVGLYPVQVGQLVEGAHVGFGLPGPCLPRSRTGLAGV